MMNIITLLHHVVRLDPISDVIADSECPLGRVHCFASTNEVIVFILSLILFTRSCTVIIMEHTKLKWSSNEWEIAKPKKDEILEFFYPISAKWYEIGDLLRVDDNTLGGLCTSNFSNEVKLSKVLQTWLENAEPTSVKWVEIHRVFSLVTVKNPHKPSMYFNFYHVSIINIHILQIMNDLYHLQSYAFPYSEIEFSVSVL